MRDAYDDDGVGARPRRGLGRARASSASIGLLVPEEHGGAGMGMVDAAVVLEELGPRRAPGAVRVDARSARSRSCSPRAPTREHAFLLPGLADGSTIGTVALCEPGRALPSGASRRRRRDADGDGWRLDGTKVHVADARRRPTSAARRRRVDADGELGVFAVQTGDGRRRGRPPTATVDGTRKEATRRRSTAPPAWRLGARRRDRRGRRARSTGSPSRASSTASAPRQRALELAVEYAKERVQFDKPIGSFQAVQHLCADMLRAVELGRAAGYYACWAADDADPAEAHRAATMAQAFASDAFAQLGGSAIQVFGGIGFTWEHDIHLYYKRLLSLVGRARQPSTTTSPSSPPRHRDRR